MENYTALLLLMVELQCFVACLAACKGESGGLACCIMAGHKALLKPQSCSAVPKST